MIGRRRSPPWSAASSSSKRMSIPEAGLWKGQLQAYRDADAQQNQMEHGYERAGEGINRRRKRAKKEEEFNASSFNFAKALGKKNEKTSAAAGGDKAEDKKEEVAAAAEQQKNVSAKEKMKELKRNAARPRGQEAFEAKINQKDKDKDAKAKKSVSFEDENNIASFGDSTQKGMKEGNLDEDAFAGLEVTDKSGESGAGGAAADKKKSKDDDPDPLGITERSDEEADGASLDSDCVDMLSDYEGSDEDAVPEHIAKDIEDNFNKGEAKAKRAYEKAAQKAKFPSKKSGAEEEEDDLESSDIDEEEERRTPIHQQYTRVHHNVSVVERNRARKKAVCHVVAGILKQQSTVVLEQHRREAEEAAEEERQAERELLRLKACQEQANYDTLMDVSNMMAEANKRLNHKLHAMHVAEQNYTVVREKEVKLMVQMSTQIANLENTVTEERELRVRDLELEKKDVEAQDAVRTSGTWLGVATHFLAFVVGVLFALLLVREFGLGHAVQKFEL